MCYSMPGKVVEMRNGIATVDYFGERRKAVAELAECAKGDYVYVQAGYVVKRISEEEVAPTLEIWKEMMEKLKAEDELRSPPLQKATTDPALSSILSKAEAGKALSDAELLYTLSLRDVRSQEALFSSANAVRKRELSNSCCVHGIIEFSNFCSQSCAYCGIRGGNSSARRYRLTSEQIIEAAETASEKFGFKALVLQSGEDAWYTDEKLAQIVRGIMDRCGVILFMSVGERSLASYKKMYLEGARGVLMRFETSNPHLYAKLGKGDLSKRISLLAKLREMGYLIATGSLVGLPGQTERDLLNDIHLTRKLGAEMLSFGPFLPHPETPLATARAPSLTSVLKVLATARLSQPDSKILVTTALETLDRRGREAGLLSGANSLMLNSTPLKFRKLYSIYPNKAGTGTPTDKQIRETIALLHSLGRAPTDLGISEAWAK